ncbi:MAG: hypothetical protein RL148_321 [Planctomycetota bacterium]|jgi:glucokinase
MRTVLAGDLGGTKCRIALVAEDFSVHGVQQFATVRERGPFLQALVDAIARAKDHLPAGWLPPAAIGIGTAGVIPKDGRSISYAPNLPLDGFPLADHLTGQFRLPAVLVNDGRASAWGEYLRGVAKGADPLLCLFFGTGIGIGLMVEGRPYEGFTNAAGEIGHLIHVPGGRRCPCGGLGHFEAYCGGRAVTDRALEEIGPSPDGTAWTVGSVVAHGSDAAQRILADAEAAAIALVANACTLFNPEAVVLGGGMLTGWPGLRQSLERRVVQEISVPVRTGMRIVDSLAGSDAILWGAAGATRQLGNR